MADTFVDPQSRDTLPGVIAGYRLLAPLGSGSSASVYRARGPADETPVAVKLLRLAHGADLDRRMQFEHEAGLLARLAHPGIVRLLAHGVQDERPYLATELAAGRSLAQIVAERGALPAGFVAETLRQVALALAHAHGQRVLHRDIKPSNVVVDEQGELPVAKLLDFGFGHHQGYEAAAPSAMAVGTFLYMSPEQLGILALAPDERSDLYALGIVAIELLAGRHPYAGLNLRDLIHAHAAIVPEIPANVPSALRQIVALLVRKDPSDRYRTAEGLAADLATFLARQRDGNTQAFPLRSEDRHTELVAPRYHGRAAERAVLAEAYATAQRGLQIVAVAGVSGMGKTRLIGEAARGWTRSPVLWGRGRAFGQTAGYGLMAEALRALPGQPLTSAMQAAMRHAVGSMGGEVLALVPELKPLLGDATTIAPLEPEHQQQRLFTLLAAVLAPLGTPEAPLVLILDDLQWADDGSLQFVLHLAKRLEPRSMLLVLSWRVEEVPAGGRVQQWLEQVRAAHALPLIALEPLTLADVGTVVASMLGGEVPGLAEAVAARAQGHPLHAIELTHALVERGMLRHGSQGWFLDAADAARLAQGTEDLLQTIVRRLDRLDDGEREVLAIAALAGRGFAGEVVRQVLQAEAGAAPEPAARRTVAALAAAEQAQLIVATAQPGTYSFTHDKIREALVEALPPAGRARLHERIGDVLGELAGDSDAHVYARAHHYEHAGNAVKGAHAALRAGALAAQQYAHLEALEFYAKARHRIEALPDAERQALAPRLTEAIADSQAATGSVEEACASYESLLTRLGSPEAGAELRRKLAMQLHVRGQTQRAADLFEEAFGLLGEPVARSKPAVAWQLLRETAIQVWHTARPPPRPARPDPRWAVLGKVAYHFTHILSFIDVTRVAALQIRHVNQVERHGSTHDMATAYSTHGVLCAYFSMMRRGERFQERALAWRHAEGDRWGVLQARYLMTVTLMMAARWDDAIAHSRICVAEAEQQGDPYTLSLSMLSLGFSLAQVGEWDEAESVGLRAQRIAADHGQGRRAPIA